MRRKYSQRPDGDILVIGYGNELRSDDGVGPKVAGIVRQWRLPGIRVIECHQLMPELAVSLATAGQVIFVDAAQGSCSIRSEEIRPTQSTQVMTHAVDPRALLQLTKIIYERCPTALLLTIPAEDFNVGRKLSKISRKGIEAALSHIRALVTGRRAQIRDDKTCQTRVSRPAQRALL